MLINCEECRATISDEASICPHCGIRRITKSERNKQESERINQIKIIEQQKKEKIQKIIFAMMCVVAVVLFVWAKTKNADAIKANIEPLSIRQICAATISVLFVKPMEIIKSHDISPLVSQVEYTRNVDNTWWQYQCRLTSNTVEWRAMGSSSEPNKEGRWRTNYWVDTVNNNGDSVVFYEVDKGKNELHITEENELSKEEIDNAPSYRPEKYMHSIPFSKLR
ncbi:MAG: hypothetical protein QMB40_08625 [Aeromonadaceae bacterium]